MQVDNNDKLSINEISLDSSSDRATHPETKAEERISNIETVSSSSIKRKISSDKSKKDENINFKISKIYNEWCLLNKYWVKIGLNQK